MPTIIAANDPLPTTTGLLLGGPPAYGVTCTSPAKPAESRRGWCVHPTLPIEILLVESLRNIAMAVDE